jgi:hypothetical protein
MPLPSLLSVRFLDPISSCSLYLRVANLPVMFPAITQLLGTSTLAHACCWKLAPMNEPAGYASSALLSAARQYWYDSYGNIRTDSSDVVEIIHDAFQPLSYWSGIMPTSSGYQNVMMDTHHYEIFSDDQVAMTYQQHISVSHIFFGPFFFRTVGAHEAELHAMPPISVSCGRRRVVGEMKLLRGRVRQEISGLSSGNGSLLL